MNAVERVLARRAKQGDRQLGGCDSCLAFNRVEYTELIRVYRTIVEHQDWCPEWAQMRRAA
jgi:hypothetical protein